MPNFGHYAPHMGRDVWEAGGYLKLEKGIHEAGYKNGVWDDGLWAVPYYTSDAADE